MITSTSLPGKIISLLDRRERWKLALLLVLATASGLVQMAGVGSIMPFVSVLTNPDIGSQPAFIGRLYELSGLQSVNRFMLVLGAGVLATFVLSNALMALTQWLTLRFAWWNQYKLSRRLLETHLYHPYVFHLSNSSIDTGANVLNEAITFASQVLTPLIQAVAFGITGIFLLGLLMWVSPLMFVIVVGVVGGSYVLVYFTSRRALTHLGELRPLPDRAGLGPAGHPGGRSGSC
jgi:ABC-type multidrug transport system fused ATPase/permease subunit